MTSHLTLHYAPDNASLCVRLLLEEMGTSYRTALVDRSIQAHKSQAYLQLNPNGLIPTLETPNGPIFETGAILLWLADQAPGTVFPAPDHAARGPALRRLFWVANTLHPTMRMLFYPEQFVDGDPEAFRAKTRARLSAYFDQLETEGFGPHALIACYIAPLLRWPALYGGDTAWFVLSKWPNLLTFAQSFETKPEVRRACDAEGLGNTPFSAPRYPTPPEGSAT